VLLNSSQTFVCMHETEFPASKAGGTDVPSVGRDGSENSHSTNPLPPAFTWLRRVTSWVVLVLSILVCSCTKPQQTRISPTDVNTNALANATPSARRININTATAIELEALPGVGKVLAERIIAHREQHGPFRRTEHLMMVRGFSDNKFRAIRERVTVE